MCGESCGLTLVDWSTLLLLLRVKVLIFLSLVLTTTEKKLLLRGARFSVPVQTDQTGRLVNATPRPLYLREIAPVPIVDEAAWTPVQVWTGVKGEKKISCSHRISKAWPSSPKRSCHVDCAVSSPRVKVLRIKLVCQLTYG